jgi:uncharacterized protein (TIGR00369 family)
MTLHKQPNSRMCFVCGVENHAGLHVKFYDDGKEKVFVEHVIADHHQGYPGVAHGGIVASILDEVGGRVVMINNPQRLFMTMKLEIKYRAPVPTGQRIKAIGWAVKDRGKVVTAHAEILLPDDTLLAEAELMLAEPPDNVFSFSVAEAKHLGWKVYEDD